MYEQSGMYNRDIPEQHDGWQQGQGYQAYQQVGHELCCPVSSLPTPCCSPAGRTPPRLRWTPVLVDSASTMAQPASCYADAEPRPSCDCVSEHSAHLKLAT